MSHAPPSPSIRVQAPPGPVFAELSPPGSKSLTNRALILAALAEGRSTLRGCLDSEDTRAMLAAIARFGLAYTLADDATTVTLTATPDASSVFTGWSGDCLGTAVSCSLSMGASHSVTATFTPAAATRANTRGRTEMRFPMHQKLVRR